MPCVHLKRRRSLDSSQARYQARVLTKEGGLTTAAGAHLQVHAALSRLLAQHLTFCYAQLQAAVRCGDLSSYAARGQRTSADRWPGIR